MKNSVLSYQAMPRDVVPTHRPVKLVLRIEGLREPVDILWKPKTLADKFPPREKTPKHEIPPQYGPSWKGPDPIKASAQLSWEAWSHKAE